MSRRHALIRLSQRYGVRRNAEGVIACATAKILHGQAKFIQPLEMGRSLWVVYVARRHVRCVWEESTKSVVTVLPQRARRRDRLEVG
jgi:hypothetical protein